jgi:hypothetical protein
LPTHSHYWFLHFLFCDFTFFPQHNDTIMANINCCRINILSQRIIIERCDWGFVSDLVCVFSLLYACCVFINLSVCLHVYTIFVRPYLRSCIVKIVAVTHRRKINTYILYTSCFTFMYYRDLWTQIYFPKLPQIGLKLCIYEWWILL